MASEFYVDDFIITIDIVDFISDFSPTGLYDLIPYNMDWAMARVVCGTLTQEQKVLLQETSLSNG